MFKRCLLILLTIIIPCISYAESPDNIQIGAGEICGLYGYDSTNNDWDKIKKDNNGNLMISLGTALDYTGDDITIYNQKPAAATGTIVACNTTTNGELLLASNANRIGVRIVNHDPANPVWICLGDTTCSTSTDGMQLSDTVGLSGFEDYHYTGAIYCTVNSGTANVFVGEY